MYIQSNDFRLSEGFSTINGRLGIACKWRPNRTLAIFDIYHGKIIPVPIENDPSDYQSSCQYSIANVDGQRILLRECDFRGESFRLFLLQLDLEKFECKKIAQLDEDLPNGLGHRILVDQKIPDNFLIGSWATLRLGRLDDSAISIHEQPLLLDNALQCARLENGVLCGLEQIGTAFIRPGTNVSFCFCRYNLRTMQVQRSKPIMLTYDGNPNEVVLNMQIPHFAWSRDNLYMSWDGHKIHYLDFATQCCSQLDVKIEGKITGLFVDDYEFLTVSTMEHFKDVDVVKPFLNRVYQFALRRPDCLQNLAWSAILSRHALGESDLFKRVAPRLPYNSHLRCPLPERGAYSY